MKLALLLAFWLVVVIAVGAWRIRRAHQRLASSRPSLSRADLVHELEHLGAQTDVAEAVADWASFYLSRGLALNPADRLIEDIRIDPDDVSDFVSDFYKENAMPQPTRKSPETLPATLTVSSLAQYLSERRAMLVSART